MLTERLRVGAVCAGVGGLELAVASLFPTELVWVSEIDPAASTVLERRFGVPNLGDLTAITDPPEVDLLCAGFPCQPVSQAGKRAGVHDERWLIRDVMGLARRADARWVLLENVRGLLTANQGEALRQVFAAVADHGYDAWWTCVRASDVGAPHRRERWFCLAADSSSAERGAPQQPPVGAAVGSAAEPGKRSGTSAAADADSAARDAAWGAGEAVHASRSVERSGRCDSVDWGPFDGAIRRWEQHMGTAAPVPVNGKQLSPVFVEWMMGYPTGWVTDLELTRTQMLKMLGNAVVPQQGAYAIAELLRLAGGGLPDQQPADDVRLLPTPTANQPGGTWEHHLARKARIGDGATRTSVTDLRMEIERAVAFGDIEVQP